MSDRMPPPSHEPVAASVSRPCPCALALGRVPARRWRTRAEVARLLEDLRRRIETNPAEETTNERLSREIGLSEHHLVRLFRVTFGRSPAQYRSECRLESARRRLEEGASVLQAALSAGYTSVPTFTRLFVRRFGCTPGSFRARG